jgi:hypothetical protein
MNGSESMSPGKWLVAGAMAVAGVIAVGYFAGGLANDNLAVEATQGKALIGADTNNNELNGAFTSEATETEIDACMSFSFLLFLLFRSFFLSFIVTFFVIIFF